MNGSNEPVLVLVSGDVMTPIEVAQASTRPMELVRASDMEEARKLLLSRGNDVDVLLCDRHYKEEEYALLFNDAERFVPHVQCALACLEFDLDKVIATKNMVTSMSVFRMPWNPLSFEPLFDTLVERAAGVRRREGMLSKSLVDEFRLTRDNRIALCSQAFAQELSGAHGGKLMSYFSAARQIQEVETFADLKTFDSFAHVANEAKRIQEIVAHVREWWARFDQSNEPSRLPEVFELEGESARIKDVVLQMEPINGLCGQLPGRQACALLAWLLYQPQTTTIRRCSTLGSWVVDVAASKGLAEGSEGPLIVLPRQETRPYMLNEPKGSRMHWDGHDKENRHLHQHASLGDGPAQSEIESA